METEALTLAETLDDYRARQALSLEREREFSGQLSHELRTPLSVVRGQAELIDLQYADDKCLHKRAQEIMAHVDRMRDMIEQLLRLARSARIPARTAVPLHEMAERIWSDLLQTGSSDTWLNNRIPLTIEVQADPVLLELILRNAFANAREHANGAELRLSFDKRTLQIEDFDSSGRSDYLPADDGAGLGMTILRRACSALGWECQVETLSTGMCLRIRLDKP
jgi:signal transduction histidine kinase